MWNLHAYSDLNGIKLDCVETSHLALYLAILFYSKPK